VSGRRSREAGTQQAVSVAHVHVPRNPNMENALKHKFANF
jgi:hypothetical protein